MKNLRALLLLCVLCIAGVGVFVSAEAQPAAAALDPLVAERLAENDPNLVQLIVGYRTMRNTIEESPAVAARLDLLERTFAAERAAGRVGEARRALYEAFTVLGGGAWDEARAFALSLVARTDQRVTDPVRPLLIHLTQLYAAGAPGGVIRVEATLRDLEAGRRGQAQAGAILREVTATDAVPRDLIETPLTLRLDLGDVPAGPSFVALTVSAGGAPARELLVPIHRVAGLAAAEHEIVTRAARLRGFESARAALGSARASVLYPVDFALQVNLGWRAARGYDFEAEIERSRRRLIDLEAGRDPLAAERGVFTRHYRFAEAGGIMPYGVHVPSAYDPARTWPLIVALHGLGGDESTLLARDGGLIGRLAEERGYLVAAPLGFRPDGGYGRPAVSVDPVVDRRGELSELDVLNVIAEMRALYAVDPARIYLMGHSMGANGTWRLGSRNADLFAALAPVAGGSAPPDTDVARLATLPIFAAHGASDATAPIDASRRMVARVREAGGDCTLFEVADADHSGIVSLAVPRIFDFFDRHRRR